MKSAIPRLLTALLLVMPQAAFAAGCGVTSASLAFGTYGAGASWHVDSQGAISFTCTGVAGEVVMYTISLSTGNGGTGFNPRGLKSGANVAQYNVYTDAARTRIWGDGSSGSFTESGSISITAGPAPRSLPVYGRVFGAQSPPPGAYGDSLMITLSF